MQYDGDELLDRTNRRAVVASRALVNLARVAVRAMLRAVDERDALEEQARDASLVKRMSEGDPVALDALYQRHFRGLYALGQVMLRNAHEAEDLTHDVFLEAWRRSAEYSAERGSVRAWLFMRARSRALDRLKAAGRGLGAVVESVSRATPNSLVERYRLRTRLSKMPEAQQQVLILGYFEGLTTVEIAERLSIPAGTVKSRTRAALAALREKFAAAR